MVMPFQMTFGRRPSDGGEHTMWAATVLGKNRIKTLLGEGFGLGGLECQILCALEEEGSLTSADIASRVHSSTGKVQRELNRLSHLGCVKQAQGGGGE